MRRAVLLTGAAAALATAGCGGRAEHSSATLGFAQLPMAFERNVGQAPPAVRLLARGPGYTLLLTDRAPVLRLGRPGRASRALRLGLAHTSPAMRLAPTGARAGHVNYLVGPRAAWHLGVPSYAGARYGGAYPGIDVAFHGTDRALEFDFELAPGADPARIALAPRGQHSLHIDGDGALVLRLPGGVVRERRPVSRQVVDGAARRVPSRFVRRADGTIGIAVGRYDRRRPLTIDPVLTYGSYLGGASVDLGNGIAVDAAGAAYVTGETQSANFPATTGAAQTAFAGSEDAFVAKLAPDGRSLAWSTYLGGSGIDIGNAVAVDGSGAAYVTGSTTSTDLPTTPGALQTAIGGGSSDGFVAKLAPSGAALSFSTYLGGTGTDQGTGIAVTAGGATAISGLTGSADFPVTAGAFQTAYGGGASDAFVAELTPSAAGEAYATYLGGASADSATRLALDATGAAYVAGRTSSAAFPVTAGALQTTLHGSSDAFATKVSPSGASLAFSTLLGGGGTETGEGIAVDSGGSAYLTGSTSSTDFPVTAGAAQAAYGGGGTDAFVARLAANGGALDYATLLGGGASDSGRAVAVDGARQAFVTGQTASTDFPASTDALQASYPGGASAAFLTRLSATGARTFSTFFGGSSGASAQGIALDGAGAAYLTGSTSSGDIPVTTGAAQTANGGSTDAFVAKLVAPPPATTTPTTSTTTPATTPATTPTQTTPAPAPRAPTLTVGTLRVRWDRLTVTYRTAGGAAVRFDVVTPSGREISADLAAGTHRGTLKWNRRVAGRVAPPGHYHLTVTASSPDGGETTRHLGVTLRVLYAHAPRIRNGAARIAYELTEPGLVTLAVARVGGHRTVVARAQGRRGPNHILWNLRIGGRRVSGGEYLLFVTARTRKGFTASVAVPAR